MPRFQVIRFRSEAYAGPSQTVRVAGKRYQRWDAARYNDAPADLSDRQANFYRNLIALALALDSRDIPVDFTTQDGRRMYLDHGCIKIAEHAGFIQALENNDENGTVGHISLVWAVTREAA